MIARKHLFKSLATVSIIWTLAWVWVDYPMDGPKGTWGSFFNMISYPIVLPFLLLDHLLRLPANPLLGWGIPATIIFGICSLFDFLLQVYANKRSSVSGEGRG